MNPLCKVFVTAILLVPVVCSSAPEGTPSSGSDSTSADSANDGGAIKLAKAPQPETSKAAAAFQHIVIIFQENRTPDNLFHDPVLRFS